MSIKNEFNKMSNTTTDPMAYLTEAWEAPGIIDAEVVEPDPVPPIPSIHVPTSITKTMAERMQPAVSAFKAIDREAQDYFLGKLIALYRKHEPLVLSHILKHYKLTESIIMPTEDVVAPEPTAEPYPVETPEQDFRARVEELKNEIEAKKGSGTPEEEKAWDDITSAFDLIAHHLDDIQEDEQAPDADQPERHPAI